MPRIGIHRTASSQSCMACFLLAQHSPEIYNHQHTNGGTKCSRGFVEHITREIHPINPWRFSFQRNKTSNKNKSIFAII